MDGQSPDSILAIVRLQIFMVQWGSLTAADVEFTKNSSSNQFLVVKLHLRASKKDFGHWRNQFKALDEK